MTGSFKARGALNKVLALDFTKEQSIITSSTGNHAMAFANAVSILTRTSHVPDIQTRLKALIVMPENVSSAKLDNLKKMIKGTSLEIKLFGTDPVHAENEAIRIAKETNATYVSPYNDIEIMGG